MSLPKSQKPPEVHFTSAGIVGWDDFAYWASRNHWLWNTAVNYGATTGLGEHEALKIIAYHLILENREMKDAMIKFAETHGSPLYTSTSP